MRLYAALMRMQHSFPVDMEHTSSDTIRSFLFYVRNGHRFAQPPAADRATSRRARWRKKATSGARRLLM